jgi:phenylacetate-CoA ligase
MLPINVLLPYHFFRAGWAHRHFRANDPRAVESLRRYQEERARRIVAYAAKHSPFYREHWAGYDPREWRSLPTVDKAAMMTNFDRFNTYGVTKEEAFEVALRAERERDFAPTLRGNLTVGLSSGTSGHRGAFLVSPAETAAWAGTVLQRVLHRLPPSGYRVAFFLRSNSNLYERVNGRVRFRWFDLMTPVLEAVSALNVFQPNLVVGPPSLLLSLAKTARRGILTIRPERLVSVAETLEPQDKAELETTFGVSVGQVYQCTEGFLAATCPAGRLHINEDLVAMQFERLEESTPGTPPPSPLPIFDRRGGDERNAGALPDAAGRVSPTPAPPLLSKIGRGLGGGVSGGQRVTPIITDLWRRTQPIIRYRLGDVLTLEEENTPCPCGCGFRVIRSIEGRCDDVCYFPDVSTGAPRRFYPDTIRRMILLADDSIADYAAVQDTPGHLRIHVAVTDGTDFAAVRDNLLRSAGEVLAQYDCQAAMIDIVEGLPGLVPGTKRRRVISLAKDSNRQRDESPDLSPIK